MITSCIYFSLTCLLTDIPILKLSLFVLKKKLVSCLTMWYTGHNILCQQEFSASTPPLDAKYFAIGQFQEGYGLILSLLFVCRYAGADNCPSIVFKHVFGELGRGVIIIRVQYPPLHCSKPCINHKLVADTKCRVVRLLVFFANVDFEGYERT